MSKPPLTQAHIIAEGLTFAELQILLIAAGNLTGARLQILPIKPRKIKKGKRHVKA